MVRRSRRSRFRRMRRRRMGRSLRRPVLRRSRRRFRIRPEVKYQQFSGVYTVSSVAGLFHFNDITGGTDVNQRVGNRIVAKSLIFSARADIASSNVSSRLRILIVADRTVGAGLSIAVGDVLSSFGPDPITQLYSITNSPRYRVLRDVVLKMDTADHPMRYYRTRIRMNNFMQYEDSTSGSCNRGKLAIIFFSDTAIAANEPKLQYVARIKYVDA